MCVFPEIVGLLSIPQHLYVYGYMATIIKLLRTYILYFIMLLMYILLIYAHMIDTV